MQEFFNENGVDQFLYKYDATGLGNIILPTKIEIRGSDNYIKFASQAVLCSPDIIFNVTDTVIRNRKFSSCITSEWTALYTPIYELMMIAPISELKQAVGVHDLNISDKAMIAEDKEVVVNLTQLSPNLINLNLSKQSDPIGPSRVRFETGGYIPQPIKTYQSRGTTTFHMNREEKIYLMEHFETRDETDVVKEFKISFKRKEISNKNVLQKSYCFEKIDSNIITY